MTARSELPTNTYATDGLCHNSNPGTYGHECGKPAEWVATNGHGFSMGFCGRCREHGRERLDFSQWRRTNGQASISGTGADHAGLARLKAEAPLKPSRPQEPCDLGLFSDSPPARSGDAGQHREEAMSYSCTDFVDSILDALHIEVPEEAWDNPSAQADLALSEIERLRRRALPESTEHPVLAARAALAHLREAHRLLRHAPRTKERVRLAITSAGGAIRNAECRQRSAQ